MKLQISAAHGPGECERAAALALQRLSAEAAAHGIRVAIHDERRSRHGIQSAVITLSGEKVAAFAARWQGTIQWIWQSRIRPRHPRKNWYIGIYPLVETAPVVRGDILIQSCKAGGKGGQHVNKTRSAVWATDSVSGLRVKVQAERSQHANRRLACQQLDARHAALAAERESVQRHAQHCRHFQIERGNPVRIFVGDDFRERA